MDNEALERVYKEKLEERIISHIASEKGISLTDAMSLYYQSPIADKIATGEYDIQYLDYKLLSQFVMNKA